MITAKLNFLKSIAVIWFVFALGELAKCKPKYESLAIAERIPAEMFFQIFKNYSCTTLKNCRLVCTTWRNTIDDNPKLIKEFTFDILDARTFLECTISTKVKSIQFRHALYNSEECLLSFFASIGTTVEEISICYPKDLSCTDQLEKRDRQLLMFKLMLECCYRLKSLKLSYHRYNHFIPTHLSSKYTTTLFGIKRLSIHAKLGFDVHSPSLYAFILSLQNLSFIEFYSYPEIGNSKTACQILWDYLKKYNGNLKV